MALLHHRSTFLSEHLQDMHFAVVHLFIVINSDK